MEFIGTTRIAQLSGSNRFPETADPDHWKIQNDTAEYGALGFDEGANTEHDGRLYFFVGDIKRVDFDTSPFNNSHLVAWTADAAVTARAEGGIQLTAVKQEGTYWLFQAGAPVGITLSLEPPTAAFSHGGRIYVFTGVGDPHYSGQTRPGDPLYGVYIVSSDKPDQPIPYRTEFLFNPRLGVCAADGGNHDALGYQFVAPQRPVSAALHEFGWFRCSKCRCLFKADTIGLALWGNPPAGGVCKAGGRHESPGGHVLAIPYGASEDNLNQGQWRRCIKCEAMFWTGYAPRLGACPATGPPNQGHIAAQDHNYVFPHDQPEDLHHQAAWRSCKKCQSLFWDGHSRKGCCPVDPTSGHDAIREDKNYPASLQDELILTYDVQEDSAHQGNWRFCTKCFGLFYKGDPASRGVCPCSNSDSHDHSELGTLPHMTSEIAYIQPPVESNFVLTRGVEQDMWHQAGWRRCTKCALMFFNQASGFHFEQWSQLAKALPSGGDPATMVWPDEQTADQQHLFYRGLGGAINHIFWNRPTGTFSFEQWAVPPNVPAAASDPAPMVTPGQQHVFYRGTDGAINHVFWDAPTNSFHYEVWTHLAGGPTAAGKPATMVWPDSKTATQQHLFYRGVDGAINHIFWDAPTNRFFFEQWIIPSKLPAAAGDPVAMVTPGQQHVFYRGIDGAIHHFFWDAPTNSFHHEPWGAAKKPPAAAGDPVAMVTPGQQHVFYRRNEWGHQSCVLGWREQFF